ncbi:hypothetical protein D9756_008016 [Leucocoprinus leucothites]|uniref:Uncharacterized protein n=1 Tax=Leucocoprinus leucothites TaxID=201217 RepID=A0A8H5FYI9_9AGAR|nr:hypothetical protein D9756_008016 [Leucoagaricus leucothites]
MVLWTQVDETEKSTFAFENSRNGEWFQVVDSQNFGGTSMMTWSIETAIRINFRGKAIQLFGTIDQGINVTASMDGGSPATLFQFTDAKNYRQQLFASSQLEYGDHTLVVTQLFDHFPLIVDYIQVDEEEATSPTGPTTSVQTQVAATTSETTPSSATSIQGVASDTSRVATLVSNSTKSSITPSSPTSSVSTLSTIAISSYSNNSSVSSQISSSSSTGGTSLSSGGIAGVAIAGAAVLGGILLLVCLWRQREKRKARDALRPHPLSPVDSSHLHPTFVVGAPNAAVSEKTQLRASWASYGYSPRSDREGSSIIAQGSSADTDIQEDPFARAPPSQAFRGSHSPSSSISYGSPLRPYPPPAATDTSATVLSVPGSGRHSLVGSGSGRRVTEIDPELPPYPWSVK